jgi:hypothetical protein
MKKRRKPQDYAEMRARQAHLKHLKRLAQAKRYPHLRQKEREHKRRKRKGYQRVSESLVCYHEQKTHGVVTYAEQYYTALHGCETSWPRIERAALYYSYF